MSDLNYTVSCIKLRMRLDDFQGSKVVLEVSLSFTQKTYLGTYLALSNVKLQVRCRCSKGRSLVGALEHGKWKTGTEVGGYSTVIYW